MNNLEKGDIWKNIKPGEGKAIKKYVEENIDVIPRDKKLNPSHEESILEIHKEKLDKETKKLKEEISDLKREIRNLEIENDNLRKEKDNSDYETESQRITNFIQTNMNKVYEKERRIEEKEEYLRALGQLTPTSGSIKENRN